MPTVQNFITEDEIDAAMTRGSGISGGKGRIYAFFMENHTDKEKVRFLKDEYGIGGHSHALSGATFSGEDHDGKGLHYKKQDCPDVHFSWEKVAKRITGLVQKGRYLTEQEQAQYDKIQAEKALAEEDAIQAQPTEVEEETAAYDLPEHAYHVGDTVYLDDKAFHITDLSRGQVQLLDPTLRYPIYRAESRDHFERLLKQDPRNRAFTDFLSDDLEKADDDLKEVLTAEGGLLSQEEKKTLVSW